jgi:hypothetical protein
MDKEYILIKKEDLQALVEDAILWRAMGECTELYGELSLDEWDATILEYCENQGISFPSDFSGGDALDVLIYYEIEHYIREAKNVKREED